MKVLRTILCIGMVLFLLFTPGRLAARAQQPFVDARFVRNETRFEGSIVLYHIVRARPYAGSLTQWLRARASAYEKRHKGTYIEIEGMDEAAFYERMEHGRRPDAYSFFSGTLYRDRLGAIDDPGVPLIDGLFVTDRCVPYCFSGYLKLIKSPESAGERAYYADDITAARLGAGEDGANEMQADVLYLDFRRAGDLIRYRDGFALAQADPIDGFTDAVCWLGVDRETDEKKAEAIRGFFAYLLEPDAQQTLNALGLLSVRGDVRNAAPDAALKPVFRAYETVETVDPFLWYAQYDALLADAGLARAGDAAAQARFSERLRECTE